MNNRRLTARDYKTARPGGFDLRRWREFGAGLALGLVVALAVYISDRRGDDDAEVSEPAPEKNRAATESSAAGTGGEETEFAFYDMLPKFEVVVPEKERSERVDSASRIERPGIYFLQVGSYKSQDEAERVRAQLARQDITANVQRVAVDADVWHRVRIGPIRDLAQLNRTRQQLQAADRDTLVIRVEE